MRVLSLKNQEMGSKTFFMEVTKNNKTFGQKNVLMCSKVTFLAFLNTPKLFFGQMGYYIFVTVMKKAFENIS